jgi:hypothetical protein
VEACYGQGPIDKLRGNPRCSSSLFDIEELWLAPASFSLIFCPASAQFYLTFQSFNSEVRQRRQSCQALEMCKSTMLTRMNLFPKKEVKSYESYNCIIPNMSLNIYFDQIKTISRTYSIAL